MMNAHSPQILQITQQVHSLGTPQPHRGSDSSTHQLCPHSYSASDGSEYQQNPEQSTGNSEGRYSALDYLVVGLLTRGGMHNPPHPHNLSPKMQLAWQHLRIGLDTLRQPDQWIQGQTISDCPHWSTAHKHCYLDALNDARLEFSFWQSRHAWEGHPCPMDLTDAESPEVSAQCASASDILVNRLMDRMLWDDALREMWKDDTQRVISALSVSTTKIVEIAKQNRNW
ncbi:uncharacterized protein I303_101416 [Kwoniella dejecticola CBS 10117]|uniref:Uncharacterized protein n=1 Tax=Kwoniella dejecticola CBS 10117 TaxID=1296121 RepID=A0A1A6AHS5_9TREE|nr:uncharacterized protein I303_01425 [Kwoniella dejecticola CBS 10117]OBR89596.1 hypothetical protein I303_01425 [Kwoniella dejecticola CBS 10117]